MQTMGGEVWGDSPVRAVRPASTAAVRATG
jgi:hypothetical protein